MSPQAQTLAIEVESAGTLQVWANLEITHREFSPSIAAVKLPHVMDYVVELKGGGREFPAQHCNPFNAQVMRNSDDSNSVGSAAGRWYDGLVKDCGFKVEPGSYTVTARTVEVDPDPRVTFQKNEMVLRLE